MAKRAFYSTAAHFSITVNPGSVQFVNGQLIRKDDKYVEFSPIGGMKKEEDGSWRPAAYGMLMTDDEEIIAYMEQREATVGDVFGPDRFHELSTPPEQRLAEANRRHERTMSSTNKLLQDLVAKGKITKEELDKRGVQFS